MRNIAFKNVARKTITGSSIYKKKHMAILMPDVEHLAFGKAAGVNLSPDLIRCW